LTDARGQLECLDVLDLTGNSLHGSLPTTFPKGLKSLEVRGGSTTAAFQQHVGLYHLAAYWEACEPAGSGLVREQVSVTP
jgi:hypothetical protein